MDSTSSHTCAQHLAQVILVSIIILQNLTTFNAGKMPFLIKSSTHEPLPMGYCLATLQDVHNNREALLTAMPGWEIACLADGWVDGGCYGGVSG